MPPLLEGDFSRLMAILGFVIAVLCIRAPAVTRLIVDLQDLNKSRPLAHYHQTSRNFRWMIIISCILAGILCAVFVVSIILVFQSYVCLSAVARNVRDSDPVILNYWVRQAEDANGRALASIFVLGILLVADFFLDVLRDLVRVTLPCYQSIHRCLRHPFEISNSGPQAPLFLWEQRIGWAISKSAHEGTEQGDKPLAWRDNWGDWAKGVDLYWDQYPEWEPSEESKPLGAKETV